MAALAIVGDFGMAERSNNGVGFTDEDRKILITVQVKMERLETDVRDGLLRIARLEADRVTRKDVEDLLAVIEQKDKENANIMEQVVAGKLSAAATEVRLAEVEKLGPALDSIKKYVWMGLGALAVLEFVFAKLLK